ncbi:MAG: hypothetical protein R3200_00030 [Xanthomonadales bacterium]|nr:hypothetical protein [Xanthomonadales bacterium]
MIRLLRIIGFLFIGLGALILLSWAFEPARQLWPLVLALPLPVKLGLVIAVIGFMVLMGSLIWERTESSRTEGNLLDDEY